MWAEPVHSSTDGNRASDRPAHRSTDPARRLPLVLSDTNTRRETLIGRSTLALAVPFKDTRPALPGAAGTRRTVMRKALLTSTLNYQPAFLAFAAILVGAVLVIAH
jgi:hypothetical protein